MKLFKQYDIDNGKLGGTLKVFLETQFVLSILSFVDMETNVLQKRVQRGGGKKAPDFNRGDCQSSIRYNIEKGDKK